MKTINALSFFMVLLIPLFVLAQQIQTDKSYLNANRDSKAASLKLLPTEVQKTYDVKWYFLNLNAENTSVAISGDATIRAEVVQNIMDTFSFHLHQAYTIDSVLINGVKKDLVNQVHERLVINLGIPKNTLFDAQIFYHGNVGSNGKFVSGISNATDHRWEGNFPVTWTLSEPNNAYEWFPVKQDLTDKADSCWVFVTTTKPNKVASNGLANIVDLPDNKVRYEWKSSYPIDYYLIFIAVAEYQDYSIYATMPQSGKQLLIQNYIYDSPACLSANKKGIDGSKDMIEFYSDIFGEYPFIREKYGHALVKNGGVAMEHQTMTTTGYLDLLDYESNIAHELAHQWFGDNVTCASWQHIWLNEGFATYSEFLWEEFKYGRAYAINNFKQNVIKNILGSGKTGSVYVPVEFIDYWYITFNRTLTYNKGGMLVHMIRYALEDDELFFNILQTYQNRFKNNVATTEDLQNVLEVLSGKDFSTFFEQWFYGEGYPIFTIKWHQAEERLVFTSEQTATAPSVTPLFKVCYELKITYTNNSTEIVPFYQDENNQMFVYNIPDNKMVKSIIFDPNAWLLAAGNVHVSSAVEDIHPNNAVTISPNPTTGVLNLIQERINNEQLTISNVEVFDVYGRKLKAESRKQNVVDISDLPSGIYFMKISTKAGDVVRKVVKQ